MTSEEWRVLARHLFIALIYQVCVRFSRKWTVPNTDTYSASQGYPLTRASTVRKAVMRKIETLIVEAYLFYYMVLILRTLRLVNLPVHTFLYGPQMILRTF